MLGRIVSVTSGLIVGLAAMGPSPAAACVCIPDGVHPPHEAVDVPRNAAVFLAPWAEEARLFRDEDGVEVPVRIEPPPHAWWPTVMRPEGLLEPGTRYRVTISSIAGSESGTEFTTGSVCHAESMAFEGIGAAAVVAMDVSTEPPCGMNSCISSSPSTSVTWAEYLPDSEALFYALEVRRSDEAAPFHGQAFGGSVGFFRFVSRAQCFPSPKLERDSAYCLRVVAFDATGAAAGRDREVCLTVSECVSEHVCFEDAADDLVTCLAEGLLAHPAFSLDPTPPTAAWHLPEHEVGPPTLVDCALLGDPSGCAGCSAGGPSGAAAAWAALLLAALAGRSVCWDCAGSRRPSHR